ncbi:putative autotransporter adhesin [Leuconostoc phage phiMH1]|uniref:Putative autotransporter adhesin n=1 Tax=Leuconostoc phage phiMH1 TaxID=912321 RepID=E3W8H0_9CAUD|nr:putative autotransporter adhesin [Leuconostoc phage phiMH1]ADP69237.1 putative autotransporter adhesin [Leuconostoc phage phiMH1]
MEAYSSSNYNGTVTASLRFYYYDSNQNYISNTIKDSSKISSWTRLTASATSPSNSAYVVVVFVTNGSVGTSSYSQPMLVFSSTVGAYVQGNYNNNSATAKAQLTADNAALNLSKYQTDADGRISKAQADITATAQQVATKFHKLITTLKQVNSRLVLARHNKQQTQ